MQLKLNILINLFVDSGTIDSITDSSAVFDNFNRFCDGENVVGTPIPQLYLQPAVTVI